MHRGWLKLYRKTLDSATWSRGADHFYLFSWLLMCVNHKPNFFQGCKVETGQIATSGDSIARALKWSRGKVRHHLALMEQDGVILANQVANRFTLITICNWNTYQGGDEEEKPTVSPTVSQPSANCQPTVSHNLIMEECKNGRMEENGEEKTSAPTALEKSPKLFSYPEDFERFWKAYPKKRAKRNAYREWVKLRPRPDLEVILAAIERLKKSGRELQFYKDPERWLKGACWEDEVEPPKECPYQNFNDPNYHMPGDPEWTTQSKPQR
jgi:hypothetical protein